MLGGCYVFYFYFPLHNKDLQWQVRKPPNKKEKA